MLKRNWVLNNLIFSSLQVGVVLFLLLVLIEADFTNEWAFGICLAVNALLESLRSYVSQWFK